MTRPDSLSRARARRLLLPGLAAVALAAAPFAMAGAANASTEPVRSCSYDIGTASLVCVDAGQDLNAAVLAEQHLAVAEDGVGAPVPAEAPSADGGVTASRAAGTAAARATYVQSRLYDDAGYGGAYFQITNSAACIGSTVYQFGPLSSVGWSGRVSSFQSFSSCTTKLWSGASYNGSSYGYATNASSVGSMNDLANSVSIR